MSSRPDGFTTEAQLVLAHCKLSGHALVEFCNEVAATDYHLSFVEPFLDWV